MAENCGVNCHYRLIILCIGTVSNLSLSLSLSRSISLSLSLSLALCLSLYTRLISIVPLFAGADAGPCIKGVVSNTYCTIQLIMILVATSLAPVWPHLVTAGPSNHTCSRDYSSCIITHRITNCMQTAASLRHVTRQHSGKL